MLIDCRVTCKSLGALSNLTSQMCNLFKVRFYALTHAQSERWNNLNDNVAGANLSLFQSIY